MKVNICYGGFERKQVAPVEVIMPYVPKPVIEVLEPKKDWKYKLPLVLSVIPAFLTKAAYAAETAETSTIATKFITIFNPLVELMQGISYPTALVMLGAGMLLVITGNKRRGLETMKWAGIGFVGMQLLPGVMEILMEVGQLIGSGVV